MKRKALALAALVSASGAQFANASDGTINFNGELTTQTCTISVNGVVAPTVATVTLPTVSTGTLTAPGETAGSTAFTISLRKCSNAAKYSAAFFESGSTVDPFTGNLRNVSGSAGDVQLQLVDAVSNNAISAGNANQLLSNTFTELQPNQEGDMFYAVRYYATGATTAGTVASSVTYSITYR
jgi:major type 1 subunit fimbrin (pilin)